MEDDVKLLEDRVRRAADRLRSLRDELAERPAPDTEGPGWQAEKAEVVAELRMALADLSDE